MGKLRDELVCLSYRLQEIRELRRELSNDDCQIVLSSGAAKMAFGDIGSECFGVFGDVPGDLADALLKWLAVFERDVSRRIDACTAELNNRSTANA